MKVPSAGGRTKRLAKGKGVHREEESEGSRRQTTDLTNRNCIRHSTMGKSAKQDEAQSYKESEMESVRNFVSKG